MVSVCGDVTEGAGELTGEGEGNRDRVVRVVNELGGIVRLFEDQGSQRKCEIGDRRIVRGEEADKIRTWRTKRGSRQNGW